MNTLYMIFISLIAGGVIGYFTKDIVERNKLLRVKEEAERFLREAKEKAQEIIRKADLDGKELLYKLRVDFEKRTTQKKDELAQLEKRISQREENLEKRLDFIESKEREISKKEAQISNLMQELTTKNNHLKQLIQEEKDKLQKISSLTPEEAKNLLLKMFSEELKAEKAIMLKQIEEEVKEEADKKAKEIISLAIQRCAVEHTTETTVSVVQLPNEEVKGRIIGREGRNIRAFEMVTGVDLVIDDTPEAVSISSFDPIRREIARIALEKLVMDGRIHPARIEEVIDKVKKDFERQLVEEGKAVAFELGIHNLHYEIIKLLGKLKYRTSFGQNALQHSKEVAFIMGILAGELGLDPRIAKRAGLLHDIGKAVDHQVEGTHSNIGGELLRKYGENEIVINTAESHHEEAEFKSIYSVLALVSDAISASRPGARRETLENYIKRLKELESIATNFEGVEKAFAIQAGREIRVIVQPNKVKDEDMHLLAYQIKKSVEKDMEYPGQIKITVIRETRTVDYAK
ncbi:MAG: ribonuclease Y [Candidatus Omnitrophica bacterium]|nr:ribonuclease Y [Candidatus Omnitrophota bacterium]MCM8823445.1 ribonuclease Y [Candidatus Omnitrophota bacterium]MCM8826465.1 ribonuclease Y [Candidatus Omnitrophota bacterium]